MGEENNKLQQRLDELLDELHHTQPGTEEYSEIVKEFKILNEAAIEAFRAESEDVNNNNRNLIEKKKSRNDLIGKIGSSTIGAVVTMLLSKKIGGIEEVGAVTTKILGFIPKWKF